MAFPDNPVPSLPDGDNPSLPRVKRYHPNLRQQQKDVLRFKRIAKKKRRPYKFRPEIPLQISEYIFKEADRSGVSAAQICLALLSLGIQAFEELQLQQKEK